jgi:hypothetical protein
MAILDFLVPDLAPEQYSSGQGTGYAQQYNLGAPNPFDVAQDYMNNMLQQKKLEQEKDLLNEKTRQEKLNQYISSIEYDPKWEIARADFENKVNEIGDFVSEWRASGKPINHDFHMELNKKKAELNTMKSENEKTFETFTKNMQTMLGKLGTEYNDEDIQAYDKSVTDAYARGGINEGFKTVSTTKPLKEFDLIGWLRKSYVLPENPTGEELKTDPAELDQLAKFKWDQLSKTLKEDQLDKLYLDGNIKEKSPEAAIGYFREQLELWDTDQKARARAARTGGGGNKTNQPTFSVNKVADENIDYNKQNKLQKGDIDTIPFWNKNQKPVVLNLLDYDGTQKSAILINARPWLSKQSGERKFEIIAIPFDDLKQIKGMNITDASQVTADMVNEYRNKAKQFPLSKYKNADIIEQAFPGVSKEIEKQIDVFRNRKEKVIWEVEGGKKMYK